MKNIITAVSVVLMLLSCGESESSKPKEHSKESQEISPREQFVGQLPNVTSIEFRDVQDIDKPDLDHIQVLKSKDTINTLTAWIGSNNLVSYNCKDYDGKMILFNGEQVVKIVYYSFTDSCRFLGYNINGINYYVPMQDDTKAYLQQIEKLF